MSSTTAVLVRGLFECIRACPRRRGRGRKAFRLGVAFAPLHGQGSASPTSRMTDVAALPAGKRARRDTSEVEMHVPQEVVAKIRQGLDGRLLHAAIRTLHAWRSRTACLFASLQCRSARDLSCGLWEQAWITAGFLRRLLSFRGGPMARWPVRWTQRPDGPFGGPFGGPTEASEFWPARAARGLRAQSSALDSAVR